MEKWLLKLVHLFDFAFIKQGINVSQLYTIVETKLLMDKRRVYLNWRTSSQSEHSNHLVMMLVMYVLISLIIAATIYSDMPLLFTMVLLHSYIIFMMAMVLITDFSSVVLDTADSQIILPKPVDGKTLFMARQVHILIYLLMFATAMSFLPILCIVFKYGLLTGLASMVTVLLSVIFSVFITYYFYLLVLRFSSEKKVRDIITWFQIVITVFFAIGYQVLFHLLDVEMTTAQFELRWYSFLIPPVWMAYALEAVQLRTITPIHGIMTILAVGVPLLLYWYISKFLAPGFASKISSLATDHAAQEKTSTQKRRESRGRKISAFFTKVPLTRAGFEGTWIITGRDKSFKLHFYPSLAYIFIFVFIFVFNSGNGISSTWQGLAETNKFLWFVYLPMFIVANGLLFVSFSENFTASWIYHSTPVQKPGQLILGSRLGLFVKYFFPVYLLMFFACLFIWGFSIVDDFVFGLANDYMCYLILGCIGRQYLPFSRQPNSKQQAGRFILTMMQMIVVAALVSLHWLVIKKPDLFYVILPVILIVCWILERYIANLQWNKIAV